MRSALAAVITLLVAAALLARASRAEPPPPMEPRELGKIITALRARPALRPQLASARFAAEVFAVKTLEVPVGSPLETLGPWSDDGAMFAAEAGIGALGCGPLEPARRATASALLEEYGDALPALLRAYTLGQEGKASASAELFSGFIAQQLPKGPCPGEHPMYSFRRVGRLGLALQCLQRVAPGRDVSKEKATLRRAEQCAANNHAVG